MLSPYTTWTFHIEDNGKGYELLKKYKGKVDVALIGRGSYIPAHKGGSLDPIECTEKYGII